MRLALAALVVAFAAVQSVFGVGLLVFGTPALLLLGLPFEQVLAYLLPCSIVISFLQVRVGGFGLDAVRRKILLLTAPAVLAGTVVILWAGHKLDVRAVVGAMLVVTAGTRLLGSVRRVVESVVRRELSPLLVLLGLVHGLSNLGGGILALIMGSLYEPKEDIRRQIAFTYGLMASIQLGTLFVTTSVGIEWGLWALLPLLAGATFLAVGQRLFRAAGESLYQLGLTGLILAFGVLLLLAP